MSWRKWLVRGLVFGIAGAVACAVLLYQPRTNPIAVHQQVLEKLRELFPGATVTLDSARLEILGGIRFNELRIVRRDDPDRAEIAYVPSGVLYHNKEEVLDGKVNFHKIELDRPRLRVVRGRDGRCNLEGLAAPARPSEPVPTVVVHQATLFLEDQTGPSGMLPIEITNADLTLLNDPLSTVLMEGSGTSETIGALQLHAAWQRDTHELTLEAKALGVPLSGALVQRAAQYCPDSPAHGLQIDGKADFEVDLAYRAHLPQPWRYDLRCHLKEVTLHHEKLVPLPLDKLDASVRCTNGKLTVEHLTARAGNAEVEAHGSTLLPCVALDFEGAVTVKHLAVCKELIDRLPESLESLKKLHAMFEPRGPVSITLECARHGGRWESKHCILQPEKVSARYSKFSYPLDGLTGILDLDLLRIVHKIDLTAYAGTQPVYVHGTWKGAEKDADVNLDIQADDILIEEKLLAALPQAPCDVQKLARSFHPSGRGDCRVLVRHTPGTPAPEFANEYHVRFRDATAQWDGFPYLLAGLGGVLHVYPRHWEFSDFQGTHHGGRVSVRGRSFPRPAGPGQDIPMVIDIEGHDVKLDADLRAALEPLPGMGKAWDTFAPEGRMNFAARIDRSPGQPQDLDVEVDVHGCTIEPCFFRYALTDLSGHFRFAHNRLTATKVSARHNGSRVSLTTGAVDLAPGGAFHADLADLQGYPLFPDADLLKAMPDTMKDLVLGLKLQDPAVVRTRLVVTQDGKIGSLPVVWWQGQMWLRDARLQAGVEFEHVTGTAACTGKHDGRQLQGLSGNLLLDQASCFKQPFHDLHTRFQIKKDDPRVLLLGLKAPLFGGEISGQARVEFNSLLRYELDLTASQVSLEQFGTYNLGPEPKLSGLAQGRLFLRGQGGGPAASLDSLEGNGSIDVPDGKLIHLPLLLDLLKFLGLRWPDRTAFQEMHAAFGIHGQRVTLNQLDLLGNPVSLSGNGEVNLDGTDIQMNFYSTWGRSEQLLPPVVRSVPVAISKSLLRIEVRGKVGTQPGDLQFTKKPVPALTDPLLQMRDRVTGRTIEH